MSMIAEYLQKHFKCQKCGKCCSQGGDMSLTAADILYIAERLEIPGQELSHYFTLAWRSGAVCIVMSDMCPCQFMDKLDKTCVVQDVKPQACKDYPFLLYERGGCTFDAVLVCPEARRLLEDLLRGDLLKQGPCLKVFFEEIFR